MIRRASYPAPLLCRGRGVLDPFLSPISQACYEYIDGRGGKRLALKKRAAILSEAALDLVQLERGSGFRHILFILLDRTRILALGSDVAIDEFDKRHWGGVRSANTGLDDARVTAIGPCSVRPGRRTA